MHSSIEKILLASKRLPENLKAIFDGLFMEGKEEEQICQEQGISQLEFENRRVRLMRELRSTTH